MGIGGTVRNLAAAAQRAAGLPSNGVQGMVIEPEALEELVERLAALPAAERASVPGIKPARADLILAGAVVVQAVLRAGGFDGLETTEAGLREGVFFERLLAGQDPPLFEDVRRASVLNLAAQYHVDCRAHPPRRRARARHVRRARRARAARRRRARARAAVGGLHAARHRHVDRLRRPPQALALPDPQRRPAGLHAGRGGDHRAGGPLPPQGHAGPGPLAALFGEGDAERLDRCAVLLRLAEDLERSRDQLVRSAGIALLNGGAGGEEVELRLIADGESAVPRWAAGRERELFARAFHRELSVAA